MNDTAQETTAVMTLLVEHEHQIKPVVGKRQENHITQSNLAVHYADTNLYIPTAQHRSAGFGLYPFLVHTALILSFGTRPGSQL